MGLLVYFKPRLTLGPRKSFHLYIVPSKSRFNCQGKKKKIFRKCLVLSVSLFLSIRKVKNQVH